MRALFLAAMIFSAIAVDTSRSAPQVQVPLAKGDVTFATLELQLGSRGAAMTLRLTPQKLAEIRRVAAANPDKELIFTADGRVLGRSVLKRAVAPDSIFLRLASADDAFAGLRGLF
jgi:hypothetical protein